MNYSPKNRSTIVWHASNLESAIACTGAERDLREEAREQLRSGENPSLFILAVSNCAIEKRNWRRLFEEYSQFNNQVQLKDIYWDIRMRLLENVLMSESKSEFERNLDNWIDVIHNLDAPLSRDYLPTKFEVSFLWKQRQIYEAIESRGIKRFSEADWKEKVLAIGLDLEQIVNAIERYYSSDPDLIRPEIFPMKLLERTHEEIQRKAVWTNAGLKTRNQKLEEARKLQKIFKSAWKDGHYGQRFGRVSVSLVVEPEKGLGLRPDYAEKLSSELRDVLSEIARDANQKLDFSDFKDSCRADFILPEE